MHFLDLPVDIVKCIADHLPPESHATLGLTCTALANTIPLDKACRRLHGNGVARGAFLELLERDVADRFYYCPECVRLHWFSRSWDLSAAVMAHSDDTPKNRSNCIYMLSHFSSILFIPWLYVRLATNRHLYGGSSGLSLSALNLPKHVEQWGFKLEGWAVEWTARIIDQELFLCGTHTFTDGPGSDGKMMKEAVAQRPHELCRHLATRAQAPLHPLQQESICSGLTYIEPAVEYQVPHRKAAGSCRVCLTDFGVEVRWTKHPRYRFACPCRIPVKHRKLDIVIYTYHNLGRGRSPYDTDWLSFTGTDLVPLRDLERHGVGAVRDRWISATPRVE